MTNQLDWLKKRLLNLYDHNPYVELLEMRIISLQKGSAEMIMPVHSGKHTNLYQVAHGGALASLADTVMGVSCVTLGIRVVTMEMNINFIRGAAPQDSIKAVGKVIHQGSSTAVVEAEIFDGSGILLAKARGTFFVTGKFECEQND